MNHKILALKAATGADTLMHAAKHLSKEHFGEQNPLLVSRAQQGAERIEAAEAIHTLTARYFELVGFVLYVNGLTDPSFMLRKAAR